MNAPKLPVNEFWFRITLKLLSLISGLIFVVTLVCLNRSYRYDHSTGWPTCDGVITSNGLKTSSNKPHAIPWFHPVVCYSFTVDGLPRIGMRIDYADRVLTFPKEKAID